VTSPFFALYYLVIRVRFSTDLKTHSSSASTSLPPGVTTCSLSSTTFLPSTTWSLYRSLPYEYPRDSEVRTFPRNLEMRIELSFFAVKASSLVLLSAVNYIPSYGSVSCSRSAASKSLRVSGVFKSCQWQRQNDCAMGVPSTLGGLRSRNNNATIIGGLKIEAC
jgi:hypothetical protein